MLRQVLPTLTGVPSRGVGDEVPVAFEAARRPTGDNILAGLSAVLLHHREWNEPQDAVYIERAVLIERLLELLPVALSSPPNAHDAPSDVSIGDELIAAGAIIIGAADDHRAPYGQVVAVPDLDGLTPGLTPPPLGRFLHEVEGGVTGVEALPLRRAGSGHRPETDGRELEVAVATHQRTEIGPTERPHRLHHHTGGLVDPQLVILESGRAGHVGGGLPGDGLDPQLGWIRSAQLVPSRDLPFPVEEEVTERFVVAGRICSLITRFDDPAGRPVPEEHRSRSSQRQSAALFAQHLRLEAHRSAEGHRHRRLPAGITARRIVLVVLDRCGEGRHLAIRRSGDATIEHPLRQGGRSGGGRRRDGQSRDGRLVDHFRIPAAGEDRHSADGYQHQEDADGEDERRLPPSWRPRGAGGRPDGSLCLHDPPPFQNGGAAGIHLFGRQAQLLGIQHRVGPDQKLFDVGIVHHACSSAAEALPVSPLVLCPP